MSNRSSKTYALQVNTCPESTSPTCVTKHGRILAELTNG